MFFRDILCFCVFLYFIPSVYKCVECALSIKPQNIAAVSGTVITLSCSSDVSKGNIAWNTISPGSSRRDIIYNDKVLAESVSSYISVSDRDDGNCTLNINASLAAAKRYICMERDSGQEASADLVVMDITSRCDSMVTANNSVDVSCYIASTGNWASVAICKEYYETREYTLDGKQVQNTWNFRGSNASHAIYCWTKFAKSEEFAEANCASNVPNDIWIHAYQPVNTAADERIVVIRIAVIVGTIAILLVVVQTSVILCWYIRQKRKKRHHEGRELKHVEA